PTSSMDLTALTRLYTLSLHDALPISKRDRLMSDGQRGAIRVSSRLRLYREGLLRNHVATTTRPVIRQTNANSPPVIESMGDRYHGQPTGDQAHHICGRKAGRSTRSSRLGRQSG